jgi:hypothetical protein
MSSNTHPISLSSNSGTEDVTSAYAPSAMPMSPATDSYMQSQQFLPASDTEASPLALSGPIRRTRQIRQLQPYEASTVVSQPALVIPPESVMPPPPAPPVISSPPPAPPVISSPPPTVFYSQTTTVPLTSSPLASPPLASPPATNRSVHVSPHQRTYPIRPTSSDSYVHRRRRRTHKRVDARKWSFLLPIMHYWRSQEGTPTARELGESSYTTSRVLIVTGEPIHHTIPLLAARMVRHEDQLNSIASILNKIPHEHLETFADDIDSHIIGHLAMEDKIEKLDTQFWESMEFIGALCGANTSMEIMVGTLDRELDKISTENMHLRQALQESRARERARDQTMEAMSAAIQELQNRMEKSLGKP